MNTSFLRTRSRLSPFRPLSLRLYPLKIPLPAIGYIAKMPAILRVAVILVRATTNHEHGFPELETRERLLSASALIIHPCLNAPASPLGFGNPIPLCQQHRTAVLLRVGCEEIIRTIK